MFSFGPHPLFLETAGTLMSLSLPPFVLLIILALFYYLLTGSKPFTPNASKPQASPHVDRLSLFVFLFPLLIGFSVILFRLSSISHAPPTDISPICAFDEWNNWWSLRLSGSDHAFTGEIQNPKQHLDSSNWFEFFENLKVREQRLPPVGDQ